MCLFLDSYCASSAVFFKYSGRSMSLSLEDIEIFITFSESRNSLHASEVLGISQPTLTEKLRAIEGKLPETPFAWRGHKRVLNSYGEHLVKEIKPALYALRRATKDVIDKEARRLIRISGRMEILMRVTRSAYLEGPLELDITTSHKALDRVLDGISDIAITYVKPTQKEIIRQKLFDAGTAFICHRDLLESDTLKLFTDVKDWSFTTDARWYLYREDDGFYKSFAKLVGLEAKNPEHGVIMENWLSIKELVLLHKGMAIVPLETLSRAESKDLAILAMPRDKSKSTFYAVYHREFVKSNRGKAMIERIVQAFQEKDNLARK